MLQLIVRPKVWKPSPYVLSSHKLYSENLKSRETSQSWELQARRDQFSRKKIQFKANQIWKDYCCYSIRDANKNNHAHCLQGLLQLSKNSHDSTVIHTAVMLKNEIIIEELLLDGVNPNTLNNESRTPLHFACHNSSPGIVKLLLESGADPSLTDQIGQNALHWCVLEKEEQDASDDDGYSPALECFKQIIIAFPKLLNEYNHDGFSPLHLALMNNFTQIVNFLVEGNYRLDQLTSLSQENVFHLSVRNVKLNQFVLKLFTEPFYQKTLIDKNYHLQPNFEGNMPIHIATSEANEIVIQLLVDSEPNIIDSVNNERQTPLMLAISELELDVARNLVDLGAWIEAEDNAGFKALHYACCLKRTEDEKQENDKEEVPPIPPITQYLIDRAANINVRTDIGDTALSLATIHGIFTDCKTECNIGEGEVENFEIVHELVEKGADVNLGNDSGNTPLHHAAERGESKLATFLISKGSKVNTRNAENETPLHLAMSCDNWDIAFYLLAAGADINAKTCEGIQPIHFIARATPEKKTLMERFLAMGVKDINAMTPEGETALDLAIQSGNKAIAKLLENRGCKKST